MEGNSCDCESESSIIDINDSDGGGGGGVGTDSVGNGGIKCPLRGTFSTTLSKTILIIFSILI